MSRPALPPGRPEPSARCPSAALTSAYVGDPARPPRRVTGSSGRGARAARAC
ncbi:hypothetical protein APASM_4660 [Actinosynnema pretiosum subsp. pretiosum]|nr:hypothetical protein APASM_4660 [Actinosynnema pretiosum subsp. pretiosum]